MGIKMNNAPVYFVIGQVQFNPILNLDSYIPAIQAKMREMQFTDYKRETVQEITINTVNGQMTPTMVSKSQFRFGDMSGEEGFLLEQDKISFFTTKYEIFDPFLDCLIRSLHALNEHIKLDYTERLGMRYLDAIQPSENASLEHYLVPEVMGLSQRLSGMQLTQTVSETLTSNHEGQLLTRVVIRDGLIGMPMDLAGFVTKIAPRFAQYVGKHAILDYDVSQEAREVFDLSRIEDRLRALHSLVEQSFQQTITSNAKQEWA